MAKKDFKGKLMNGGKKVVAKALPDKIPLSKEEVSSLQELEGKIVRLKLTIADLTMTAEMARTNLVDALNTVNKANDEYIAKVRSIATGHGVDVDDPTKGKWNLDTQTMVLSRIV